MVMVMVSLLWLCLFRRGLRPGVFTVLLGTIILWPWCCGFFFRGLPGLLLWVCLFRCGLKTRCVRSLCGFLLCWRVTITLAGAAIGGCVFVFSCVGVQRWVKSDGTGGAPWPVFARHNDFVAVVWHKAKAYCHEE